MKIYLDSARADSWTLPAGCPAIQGVTTNPSLVFQAGLPVSLATYLQLIQLMLQLPTNDAHAALQWLDKLRPAAENANVRLTIKLPCHPDWLPTITAIKGEEGAKGQAILLTGLSNPVQLLWAKSLKAAFVAPYVGRLAADGRDIWPFMQACVAVQNEPSGQKNGPALLAASIKSPDVLTKLIACGAAAATLPPASLAAWAGDLLTDAAMAQFELDSSKSMQFNH
jgi:transaldolase